MRQFRFGLITALAVYAIALLAAPESSWLIDEFNRPVHEAGHILFAPLGMPFELLGGSLLQLLLPLLIGTWFTAQRNEYAASVATWWVGQSFSSMGLVMANTGATLVPVSTADSDWATLFTMWGVSGHAFQYGQLAHGFGFLVMLVATFWGLTEAVNSPDRSTVVLPPRYRSMARR